MVIAFAAMVMITAALIILASRSYPQIPTPYTPVTPNHQCLLYPNIRSVSAEPDINNTKHTQETHDKALLQDRGIDALFLSAGAGRISRFRVLRV